jgi:hypothetical protein
LTVNAYRNCFRMTHVRNRNYASFQTSISLPLPSGCEAAISSGLIELFFIFSVEHSFVFVSALRMVVMLLC